MRTPVADVPYGYVRRMYGVDPVIGERVRMKGYPPGTIRAEDQSCSHYVMVQFDGRNFAAPCHPTDLEYLGPEESR